MVHEQICILFCKCSPVNLYIYIFYISFFWNLSSLLYIFLHFNLNIKLIFKLFLPFEKNIYRVLFFIYINNYTCETKCLLCICYRIFTLNFLLTNAVIDLTLNIIKMSLKSFIMWSINKALIYFNYNTWLIYDYSSGKIYKKKATENSK